MKPIRFDLSMKGVKITNFEELQDNFSAEILPLFQSGKLARWFKSREMSEQALAVEAIDKNGRELQQLQGLCQVLGLDADEEVLQYLLDDRQAPQAAPLAVVAEASEDEIEDASTPSTSGVDWSGQDMSGRSFVGEDLRNANLKGTNFRGADLSKADLSGADLSGADLTEANLSEAKLIKANLTGAKLNQAWLYKTDFTEANFTKADLSWAYGWKNKKDGCSFAAHMFERYEMDMDIAARINFHKADFTDANLDSVDFKRSNFTEANLTRASMNEGSFHLSNFSGANLTAASLGKAKLYDTNFTKADLSFADLTGAVFSKDDSTKDKTMVNLTDTRLTGVIGFNRPKV